MTICLTIQVCCYSDVFSTTFSMFLLHEFISQVNSNVPEFCFQNLAGVGFGQTYILKSRQSWGQCWL